MDHGNPVRFEVDNSHEKLESLSDLDAMNFSGLSQDLTRSDSPFCLEISLTTSDLPQNETEDIKRENEFKPPLSEDIYSIQDNFLGDTNIGSYSPNVQIQPITTSISSLRQFEPICKFHQIEVYNDEMPTFQNLTEGFSYTEKPELQSLVYNYAKDDDIKQESCTEENPMETSISVDKDQLTFEYVKHSPRSPHLIHCNEETLQFTENSRNTVVEYDLNPSQPQSFLFKEHFLRNVENPSYDENSCNLLDLRVNYKTEEIEVCSKETQNSEESPELLVSHQEDVPAEGEGRPGAGSPPSPAGLSRSGGASWENCRTPDTGQSFESLHLSEEDVALNEALRKLKLTNRKQHMRIHDLQSKNLHLEKKSKELQMKITKQQVFIDIINKLKENIEELIEDKYNIILERNDIKKKLQNLEEILTNTKKRLQEFKKEKETLQHEVKKIKVSYIRLQERCITEMQQKNTSVSQCIEMDKTLSKKEEEIERLQQLKGELEKATTSALDLLKREKETREQEFLSLQEEFQRHEKEYLKERQKLKLRIEKLITQVKHLIFTCENERAKNTKLQQQMDGVKHENAKLQQQVAQSTEQSCVPSVETAQLSEQSQEAVEPSLTKSTKMMKSNLFLNCLPCEEESLGSPDGKKTQLSSKIHSLLALVVGLLTCQDITNSEAEHFKENEKVSDIMLQKLRSLYLKKKDLEKELLKHRDKITAFKELIANEKTFQDHIVEVTDFDSEEAKNVIDAPVLLGAKLHKYHNLNEELDFLITKLGSLLEFKEDHCNRLIEENDKYQRHLGNLTNKVTSYEEIIKCADQRLEISHFQIAHLEERNKHLEDLIRKPQEKAKKPRSRLENHPKSLTLVISK